MYSNSIACVIPIIFILFNNLIGVIATSYYKLSKQFALALMPPPPTDVIKIRNTDFNPYLRFDDPPLRTLPRMCADWDDIAITGFSSGGGHAQQYHVSNSKKINKVGIMSSYPYSYGERRARLDFFAELGSIYFEDYIKRAEEMSKEGKIDNVEYIEDSRVYVFHGTYDQAVTVEAGKAIVKFYKHFKAKVKANVGKLDTNHGVSAKEAGGPCSTPNVYKYYVQSCGYNSVFHMFRHLFGSEIEEPNKSVGTVPLKGKFSTFNQTEFLPRNDDLSLDDVGYLYMPSGCEKPCKKNEGEKCKVALVFHGCIQTRAHMGIKFVTQTGFLEIAEVNDIILVFPFAKSSYRNIYGCWDYYGYTGSDYLTKKGKHNKVTDKILERIISGT